MSKQTHQLRAKMVGAMLREARVGAGLSLKDAAAAVGVSSGVLSSFEFGRKPISLPELELLAYTYDLSLRHFSTPEKFAKRTQAKVNAALLLSLRHRQIAAALAKQRQAAAVSQRELADSVGITLPRLRSYEKGNKPIPFPELELIASRLGMSAEAFIDQQPPIGDWDSAKRTYEYVFELPVELRQFIATPANQPYLRLAMRLSKVPVDRLRTVGEGLIDITQ
ncbi:MAG: transcriptional regulator [Anaerolineales bacterium]|nr:transcriptional regulator [Anaerolineales bacterium]